MLHTCGMQDRITIEAATVKLKAAEPTAKASCSDAVLALCN